MEKRVDEENLKVEIKKKGRPKKSLQVKEEPKKRGRKKKEKVEETEPKQKKKRGRKAAIRYISGSLRKKIPLTTIMYDNEKFILHLDIKDNEDNEHVKNEITYDVLKSEISEVIVENDNLLGTVLKTIDENKIFPDGGGSDVLQLEDENILGYFIDKEIEELDKGTEDLKNLYEDRIKSRRNEDDILINKLELLHNDDKLLKKVVEKISENNVIKKDIKEEKGDENKYYFEILSRFLENKEWLSNIDVNCWWCCHKFNTIPIGLPEKYNIKTKKFRVYGIFCSFGCVLSYGEDNRYKNFKELVLFMYRRLTGGVIMNKHTYKESMNNMLDISDNDLKNQYIEGLLSLVDDTLICAPPRCTLKSFGGNLTIEEFRQISKERKIYKMIKYPMVITRTYVESIDIDKVKDKNHGIFKISDTDEIKYNNKRNDSENVINSSKKIEDAKNRIKKSKEEVSKENINSIERFLKF